MDLASDSLFAGTSIKLEHCDGQRITHIWTTVMQRSLLSFVSGVPFSSWVLSVWFITFLQILIPLARTTPSWKARPVDYTILQKGQIKGDTIVQPRAGQVIDSIV